MSKSVFLRDLGLIDFKACWDVQDGYFQHNVQAKLLNRKEGKTIPTHNHLILCEHPHVYTLGKSGDRSNLLVSEAVLKERNASFYKIDRGGDITYHGPGQLVVYPILDLDNFFTDIHKYLRLLEEAVIQTLSEFGISAGRVEGLTGVWVDPEDGKNARKICAMGVRCSRWVTMHGLALNINPDLNYFGNIVPCGIDDKAVTSIEEERKLKGGEPIAMESVKEILLEKLADIFGFEYLESKDEKV